MKKLKITFLLLIVMLLSSATYVFAADVEVTLEGDKTAVAGETKTLTITLDTTQLDSDSVVAGMNATLTYSDNISDVSITSGDNSWTVLSTNSETGEFAATDGNQKGNTAILVIQYTVASDVTATDTISISLKDISLSVAPDYTTIYPEDVTATIEVTEESSTTELTGIKLNYTALTIGLDDGTTWSLIAYAVPDGATLPDVVWTSSDEDVVKLVDTGISGAITLSAVAEGKSTVTATTSDGAYSASCVVTVGSTSGSIDVDNNTTDGNNSNTNESDTNSNTNENTSTNTNSNSSNNNSNSNSSTSSGKNDDTTSDSSSLPYTGTFKWILTTVVVIGSIGGMCYIKFQKYRGI